MSTALRSVGLLDLQSSTPAESSRRAPCGHTHLRRLATKSREKCGLTAFAHLAQAELYQVFRFESAAGPAISLLELNSKQVICLFEFAVFYAGLTAIAFELKRDDGIGRNRLFKLEACA